MNTLPDTLLTDIFALLHDEHDLAAASRLARTSKRARRLWLLYALRAVAARVGHVYKGLEFSRLQLAPTPEQSAWRAELALHEGNARSVVSWPHLRGVREDVNALEVRLGWQTSNSWVEPATLPPLLLGYADLVAREPCEREAFLTIHKTSPRPAPDAHWDASRAFALFHTMASAAYAFRCVSRGLGAAPASMPSFVNTDSALMQLIWHGSWYEVPAEGLSCARRFYAEVLSCARRFYAGDIPCAPRHVDEVPHHMDTTYGPDTAWLYTDHTACEAPALWAVYGSDTCCVFEGCNEHEVPRGTRVAAAAHSALTVHAASGALVATATRRRGVIHIRWEPCSLALAADEAAATHGTLRCRLLRYFLSDAPPTGFALPARSAPAP